MFLDNERANGEYIDAIANHLLITLQRGTKIVIDRKQSLHDEYRHYITYKLPLYSEMSSNRLKHVRKI